jgi:hypothetical protein
MRIVLLLSSLLFAACTVGQVGTSNNNGTDAGGSNANNGCAEVISPAGDAHAHNGVAGATNAGLNCIVNGCHSNANPGTGTNGAMAPGYQFAGTLYKAGTNPLVPNAGATIQIKSGTMTLTAVTDTAGNFSFAAGSLPGAFNATTDATVCPTVTPMVTHLMGGSGGPGANSCNLCHAATGGTTTPITL